MAQNLLKKATRKEVKRIIKQYVKALREDGLPVSKAILYGSYAKGRPDKYSDIDVCIVSPRFGKDDIEEGQYLLKKRREIDLRLEPVPFSLRDYQHLEESPLLHEIKRQGLEIV